MHARILFLGTGGDIYVIGKQYRASGGIALNVEQSQLHIDPGPGSLVMAKMMGFNIRENTAVLISGKSIFRANDANAVISAMTYDGLDKRGVLVCPSSLANDDKDEKAPFVNRYYLNCIEKAIFIDNTKKIGINNVDVEIIRLKEAEECAFKFITERFTLSYIPDAEISQEAFDNLSETDILILNVPDPQSIQRKGHINSQEAVKIIKKVKPQLVLLTGFGIKMIEADPLYEARQVQKQTGIQVISAKDGMTINPTSFTTTVRQKSLSKYQQ